MKNHLSAILIIICIVGCTSQDSPNRNTSTSESGVTYGPVDQERLVQASSTPEDWMMYSGSYDGHRYSPLDQVSRANVGDLRIKWVYQMDTQAPVETSPVVVDGIMYIVEPPSTVIALDASTGRELWKHDPRLPDDVLFLGFPPTNRGVAIYEDYIFVGTLDAHLLALDTKSGAERWRVNVADNKTGHAITMAPLVVKDKVIVGISGGEAGIRGFLDAYDIQTGERAWRLFTIPGEGEPGNDTWAGDSWKTGGAPTWLTGSYDPELNLLYWGTGNPAPDWNGDMREGDNLYSCSILAINPDSGEMVWHFQFTPHDTHDWDANQIPILVDGTINGQERKLLVTANRNAFYYILDRTNGEYIQATPYAKQTWAERIDDSGRPIVLPDTEPTEDGTLVFPSLQGATNWFSPSYSRRNGYFFVAVREMGALYFKTDVDYEPGQYFLGGGEQTLNGDDAKGYVKAIDALTGDIKWSFDLHSPPWSGVMSTAGGLVFGCTNEGNFFALNDDTGESLWDVQLGAAVRSNPVSYAVDGQQNLAISAGNALFAFELN